MTIEGMGNDDLGNRNDRWSERMGFRADLPSLLKPGAGDGSRTRYPQLGRLMLYQMSYSRTIGDITQAPHTFKRIQSGHQ